MLHREAAIQSVHAQRLITGRVNHATLYMLGPALLADWLVAEDLSAGRLMDLFPVTRSRPAASICLAKPAAPSPSCRCG
jgi:DNA-binding transcriptional LysR family regulator